MRHIMLTMRDGAAAASWRRVGATPRSCPCRTLTPLASQAPSRRTAEPSRPLSGSIRMRSASAVTARGLKQAPGLTAEQQVLEHLRAALSGEVTPEDAARAIAKFATGVQQVEDFAQLDPHRAERSGLPEVVWGPGKTPAQIATILQSLARSQGMSMATRIEPHVFDEIQKMLPGAVYHQVPKIVTLSADAPGPPARQQLPGTVAVVTAGTADLAVAEECRLVAEYMGCHVFRLADVGVAGLHRILSNLPGLRAADVVIVVAGMDGALPSVVAGLVTAPVISVPTSVGYGAAFGGVAPMLSSLNSCSPGLAVVNIDNGFGAAAMATRMLLMASRLHEKCSGGSAAS